MYAMTMVIMALSPGMTANVFTTQYAQTHELLWLQARVAERHSGGREGSGGRLSRQDSCIPIQESASW